MNKRVKPVLGTTVEGRDVVRDFQLEVFSYSEKPVREALLNAVGHCDTRWLKPLQYKSRQERY